MDQLRITFPYSAAEHAEALSEAVEGRKLRLRFRVSGLVIGGAGLLWLALGTVAGEPLESVLRNTVPLVALGAFCVWGASVLLNAIERRRLRRESREQARDVESFTFSDDGFTPSPLWPEPIPWSFVDRVVETKRLLLIYHGYSKDPFYIPKHALSQSAAERLYAFLGAQFKSVQKEQKVLPRAT